MYNIVKILVRSVKQQFTFSLVLLKQRAMSFE